MKILSDEETMLAFNMLEIQWNFRIKKAITKSFLELFRKIIDFRLELLFFLKKTNFALEIYHEINALTNSVCIQGVPKLYLILKINFEAVHFSMTKMI